MCLILLSTNIPVHFMESQKKEEADYIQLYITNKCMYMWDVLVCIIVCWAVSWRQWQTLLR